MKKVVLEVYSEDSEKLLEVLGEIIEKQSMTLNPISMNKKGKDKIRLSAGSMHEG